MDSDLFSQLRTEIIHLGQEQEQKTAKGLRMHGFRFVFPVTD